MGIQGVYLDFIESALKQASISSGRMCELGNQSMRSSAGVTARTGKKYFSPRFVHISIDLNGKHGALPIDLSVPIQETDLVGSFDVLTNIGTSEHVNDQYECFANIHRLVRIGGLILHVSPLTGSNWNRHPITYKQEFFYALMRLVPYEMQEIGIRTLQSIHTHHVMVMAAFKTQDVFLSRGVFNTALGPFITYRDR